MRPSARAGGDREALSASGHAARRNPGLGGLFYVPAASEGRSSTGRAAVSKAVRCGFKSCHPCMPRYAEELVSLITPQWMAMYVTRLIRALEHRWSSGHLARPSTWRSPVRIRHGVRTAMPCGCSSTGRAPAFQAGRRGSSPRSRSKGSPLPAEARGRRTGVQCCPANSARSVRYRGCPRCPGSPNGRGAALRLRRLGVRIPRRVRVPT
jgi:hypothetical protein